MTREAIRGHQSRHLLVQANREGILKNRSLTRVPSSALSVWERAETSLFTVLHNFFCACPTGVENIVYTVLFVAWNMYKGDDGDNDYRPLCLLGFLCKAARA